MVAIIPTAYYGINTEKIGVPGQVMRSIAQPKGIRRLELETPSYPFGRAVIFKDLQGAVGGCQGDRRD